MKEIEQGFNKSEEKFRRILEAIPDLFLLVSTEGNFIDHSGKNEAFFVPPEEFIGKNITDVLPKELGKNYMLHIKKTLETKNPQIMEYELQIRGITRHFEARLLYFSINQVATFIREITKRKMIEESLKDSEKKFREAYNLANFYKDLFAHHINNVLNNIQSAGELISQYLDNTNKSDEIKDLCQLVKEQTIRGTKLISYVRKLSQLEESKVNIKVVRIRKVTKEAINFIHTSYQSRNIDIQVDPFGKNLFVQANEFLLDVIENILINAVKYNDNPIVEILVKFSREQQKGVNFIKTEFLDNEIGITESRKKYIFQEKHKKENNSKGMGFGLTLVKKIIKSYKGKIWVEDRIKGDYSKGSNFIVLIPEAIHNNSH